MGRKLPLMAISLLLFAGIPAGRALANIGPPWSHGDLTGEPVGTLADLHIEGETLRFDLSGLDEAGAMGHVSALYRVRNDGPSVERVLDFVAPDTGNVRVTLDGIPVLSFTPDEVELPASWRPPLFSPPLPGATEPLGINYERWSGEGPGNLLVSRFEVTFAPGPHELLVEYSVRPATLDIPDENPYRAYQVGYVLAPARSWASFGTLELSVMHPAGWELGSSLPLDDRGAARFEGIPSDTFAVTLRPPVDAWHGWVASWLSVGGLPFALLFGLLLGSAMGRRARRRGHGRARTALNVLFLAALAAVVAGVATAWLAAVGNDFLADQHLGNQYSYRYNMAVYFLHVPGAALLAILATPLATLITMRRRKG